MYDLIIELLPTSPRPLSHTLSRMIGAGIIRHDEKVE